MKKQRGQALILIAVGIVVMLGMTALAIDGGNAFADRRHAQNAADTAALSAALAKINNQNWMEAAYLRAASNTYDDDGVTNIVDVHSPPIDGQYACPAKDCKNYIQVKIESRVNTWFARIVGMEQLTNRVEAVAKAKPWSPFYDGHAVVALSPGDGKSNTPEFTFNGTASSVGVTGSGLFINSGDNCVLSVSGSPTIGIPYITTPGTICESMGGIPTTSGQQYPYPPSYPHLADICSRANVIKINNTNKGFPQGTGDTIQSDKIYCISGDFEINGGTYNATNVTFVVEGLVKINGGIVKLSSSPSLPLFYLPYADSKVGSNKSVVTISGNADMSLKGQVLAPASDCDISGTGDTNPLKGQLICYTIKLGGDSSTIVQYNDNDNSDEPPQIELSE